MTTVSVRQSGGANIVSIPKTIVKMLSLTVGSKLELTIHNNQIVLTPIEDEMTLESLLADSPSTAFLLTDEDNDWLQMQSQGGEV